jgi:hypothetical protein
MGMSRRVRRALAKGADPMSITYIEQRRDPRKVKGKLQTAHQVRPIGLINDLSSGCQKSMPDYVKVGMPARPSDPSRHRQ